MYLMLHLDLDLIIRNAIETREISVDGDAEESRNMSDPIIGSVDFSYLSSVGEDTHLQPRLAKLITEASEYISSYRWVERIEKIYLGDYFEGIIAILLFEIEAKN